MYPKVLLLMLLIALPLACGAPRDGQEADGPGGGAIDETDVSVAALERRIEGICLDFPGVTACRAELSPNRESGSVHLSIDRRLGREELQELRVVLRDEQWQFYGKVLLIDDDGRRYDL